MNSTGSLVSWSDFRLSLTRTLTGLSVETCQYAGVLNTMATYNNPDTTDISVGPLFYQGLTIRIDIDFKLLFLPKKTAPVYERL